MADIFSAILGLITFIALLQLFNIAATLKQLLTVSHVILDLLQKAAEGQGKGP